MKNTSNILFAGLISVICISLLFSQKNYLPKQERDEETENGKEYENLSRDTFQYSPEQFYSILKAVNQMPNDKCERSINAWEFIGPDTIIINDSVNFCGRARCIRTFVPQNQFDLGIRVSTGSGGLWNMKRDVNGKIYAESIQGDLPILDIGAFDIHPNDINTMIAGTGEPGASTGVGIFKTTDGGIHWFRVDTANNIPNCYHKIFYNPQHPDTILAATSSYLTSSIDGGITWAILNTGDFTDVEFNPVHPDTVYAIKAYGGFYRDITGGYSNFSPIGTPPVTFVHGCMAIAPTSPNIIYACVCTGTKSTNIYKSIDAGNSWNRCHITNRLNEVDTFSIHWNQDYYNNAITVSPTDANLVLIGAGDISRSTDGLNFMEGFGKDGHHDHHGFAWQTDGSVLDANDGGLFVSYNNGAWFNSNLNHLPVSQFYEFDLSDYTPDMMVGALQDNGNAYHHLNLGLQYQWKQITGGDGFSCGISPVDPFDAVVQLNGELHRSLNAGTLWPGFGVPGLVAWDKFLPRYERATNLASPNIDAAWIKGKKQLYRRDSSSVWSPMNDSSIFDQPIWRYSLGNRNNAGELQNVYVTLEAQSNNEVFVRDRNNGLWYNITNNLPSGAGTCYITGTAYYNNDMAYAACTAGDSLGKVYMTNDAGISNWIDITGNLKLGMYINSICSNPNNPNEVFIGTYRFGVFRTIIGSNVWTHWVNGFPNGMNISAMEVVDSSSTIGKIFLVASSYGRGMWRREITGEDPSAVKTSAMENNFSLKDFPIIKSGNEIAVKFEIEKTAFVKIELYDLSGHLLQTICNQKFEAGDYSQPANSNSLSSGIYLCSMLVNEKSRVTKKMVVVN